MVRLGMAFLHPICRVAHYKAHWLLNVTNINIPGVTQGCLLEDRGAHYPLTEWD